MKEAGVHLRLQPGNHFWHESNFFALLRVCNQEVYVVASCLPSVETVQPSFRSQNDVRHVFDFSLCVADGSHFIVCFQVSSLIRQPRPIRAETGHIKTNYNFPL